jgi:predicted nucleic acid-binding protein
VDGPARAALDGHHGRGIDRALIRSGSQHRHFRLPDLIIAATAEEHGATVLHYDADYDRIAAVTGQPAEWVAPRGSL